MTSSSPGRPDAKKQRFLTILKVSVTLLGLYLVLSRLDLTALSRLIRGVNPWWMVAGAAMMLLSMVVRAYRWRRILIGVGSSIRFTRLVELYLVGSFFNAFLPSGLGGDVVRAAEATQDVESSIAVGSVIVDRLTGLMALFGMALAALPLRPPTFPIELAWLVGSICTAGLFVGFVLIDGRLLRTVLSRFPDSIRLIGGGFFDRLARTIDRCGWRALGAALLISVGFNLIQIGWWATTGKALGLVIPFSYYLLVVPLMSLALLIPSIGGLGVREWLAPALFAGAGIPAETAVALSLLVFGLERLASLLGAPVYLYTSIRDARAARASEPTIPPR